MFCCENIICFRNFFEGKFVASKKEKEVNMV